MTGRRAQEVAFVQAATGGALGYHWMTLVYVSWVSWQWQDRMSRPWLAVAAVVAMTAVTALATVLRRATVPLVLAGLAVAALGIVLTVDAYPRSEVAVGVPTLTGVWSAAPVLLAAVRWGARGGLASGVFIATVNLLSGSVSSTTLHSIVLLLLAGGILGWAFDVARVTQARMVAALAAQERMAERERLSRAVHDGVLQTLAFINRRGHEIGGEAAELADLAADSESSLRTLIARAPEASAVAADDTGRTGRVDLGELLGPFASERVDVVRPADPVIVPLHVGTELRDAVGAALDNVRQHAGDGARTWILVEDEGDEILLTVRDDGVGTTAQRLAEAEAAGRLGVASSIRGRVTDLGGRATWATAPGSGCTITLSVPVPQERTPAPA
ncbi:MacS family sensor histidine kinase [Janibacter massiliensis]|uniref:MacS family sensor histidine kinase n=1 Tax=Janibacter massiliensis TaxID=2058291 RepID=UPI000D0F67D3|nr:DUF5931 domain-containing protein [Janibacter massiliensis]